MFYKASKDLWVERVELPGGKTKEISAKTRNALAKKLAAYSEEKKHGKMFEDIADEWLESHSAKIEITTAQAYAPHVSRAKKFFKGERIIDITPDQVQSYVDYLVSNDYAKDTVRRGLHVVNDIFMFAITQPESTVRYNPCSAVKVPRGLKQEQREPPTDAQLDAIVPDDTMGLFACFLLYTGLRPCELLALTWNDIDRKNKTITINKDCVYPYGKPIVKPRTKTSAGIRTVPLLDVLNDMLPTRGCTGYVFGGEAPMSKNALYRGWSKWCCEHGIGEVIEEEHTNPENKHKYIKRTYKANVTFYQFRHEYASVLEDEKISEFAAKNVMGHSSITVTKDIYTHIRYRKKNATNEISDKLNKRYSVKNDE